MNQTFRRCIRNAALAAVICVCAVQVLAQTLGIAVLDRDYLTVPLAEMGAMRSLLTMVGGRIVHAAGPFEGTR